MKIEPSSQEGVYPDEWARKKRGFIVYDSHPKREPRFSVEDQIDEWFAKDSKEPLAVVHQPSRSNRLLFSVLAKDWYKETALKSSLAEKISHMSYLRIIRMGDDAIPLILEEMKKRPSHWFVALDVLVDDKEKPVIESGTSLTQVAASWIKWGEDNGYL